MKSVKSINQRQSIVQTTYDIIKAHDGDVKVETKAEDARQGDSLVQATTFIIQLPIIKCIIQ